MPKTELTKIVDAAMSEVNLSENSVLNATFEDKARHIRKCIKHALSLYLENRVLYYCHECKKTEAVLPECGPLTHRHDKHLVMLKKKE